jgi:hypothetical protein
MKMTIDLIAAFRGCRLTFSYYCSQLLLFTAWRHAWQLLSSVLFSSSINEFSWLSTLSLDFERLHLFPDQKEEKETKKL